MEEIQKDREIQVIQQETSNLKSKIEVLQIVDESSEKIGATYLSFLTKATKNLEAARVRLKKPVMEAAKNIDNEFRAMMELPEKLCRILKDKQNEYNAVKAKRESEKNARVQQFAADNNLPVPAADAVVSQPAPVRTVAGTVYEKKRWRWAIIDEPLIPREFLMVDEKKINSRMRENTKLIHGVSTMNLVIPGIKFYQESDVAVRT